jgi:DNA-binding PadR family transcriptional regulator
VSPRDELTELEQCVLGVIWRDGPVTAYEVANLFATSLSSFWSGSAGAIYPVVQRLRRRGLVHGAARAWNGTRKTVLTATDKGVDVLRAWLTPPLPIAAAGPTYDSIRTRMFFMKILPIASRRQFVEDAERITREQMVLARQTHKEQKALGNESEALGVLGVILEMKARLTWLRAIRDSLKR